MGFWEEKSSVATLWDMCLVHRRRWTRFAMPRDGGNDQGVCTTWLQGSLLSLSPFFFLFFFLALAWLCPWSDDVCSTGRQGGF